MALGMAIKQEKDCKMQSPRRAQQAKEILPRLRLRVLQLCPFRGSASIIWSTARLPSEELIAHLIHIPPPSSAGKQTIAQ